MNPVHVDLDNNRAVRGDIIVKLHASEAEALYSLNERLGEAVSRADLAVALWGMRKLHPAKWDECIKAYIYTLRRKIEPLGGKIETVKGQGVILTWEKWELDTGQSRSRFTRWPQDRQAIVAKLRSDDEVPFDAIAERLGVSVTAAKNAARRARNQSAA